MRSPMWVLMEVFSAIFVVTGLLAGIYSGVLWLRAVTGIAMVVLVSSATFIVLERYEDRHRHHHSDQDEDQDS